MKQFFLVILSLVILVTSMGFTVSSHICGGRSVRTLISIGRADVSCGMEKDVSECSTNSIMKNNCCQDIFQLIQNDENYTQQHTSLDFFPNFLVAFVTSYVELIKYEQLKDDFILNKYPPPVVKDIPILIQSMLI